PCPANGINELAHARDDDEDGGAIVMPGTPPSLLRHLRPPLSGRPLRGRVVSFGDLGELREQRGESALLWIEESPFVLDWTAPPRHAAGRRLRTRRRGSRTGLRNLHRRPQPVDAEP